LIIRRSSWRAGLDPVAHIRIGEALRSLPQRGVAVVGSGQTFHNMAAFRSGGGLGGTASDSPSQGHDDNEAFEAWLRELLEPSVSRLRLPHLCKSWLQEAQEPDGVSLDPAVRRARIAAWADAPGGAYSHPREEHLIPLLVCLGAANCAAAQRSWHFDAMGWRASHYVW
jgi:4,5-DOPA dioxygenase extradiol